MNMLKKRSLSILFTMIIMISMTVVSFADDKKEPNEPTKVYEVIVDGKKIELEEGETTNIPLTSINNENLETYADFPGDAGLLKLWVSGDRVKYNIKMYVPANSFKGYISIANLNTGFLGGNNSVSGFSGSVKYKRISGHRYRASLSGRAYLGTKPVAKPVNNGIVFKG